MVTHSNWVAIVVPALKGDVCLRLCGALVSGSQYMYIKCVMSPTLELLFAVLAGGKHFTKLDRYSYSRN